MNPKPLSSLNHLTVPVAIVFPPALIVLRTRRLLGNSYERWHCVVGRTAQPDPPTVALSSGACPPVLLGHARSSRRSWPCASLRGVCERPRKKPTISRAVSEIRL